ncbi:MaoC/PaaZ C-terminal domain-containing protein [Cryptosporangium phraense]|uniref:Dehydratase n=1 Tax=Cryptosporangium phraense TaxID=2593070 RepID=A0A545AY34_9ACTN|nr:MaoC/PaaZ C-terminal domain-containing protein [Cryptosporangium phraense]TQS46257.1 dehydratase [Cryptosporangium phraense]
MESDLRWADLAVGRKFRTPARTITEADVVQFAALTGDRSPMHTDYDFARASDFGEPIAHGLLGLSYAHGLMFGTELLGRNAIAFLGIEEWRFHAPIAFGDTIHCEFSVASARLRRNDPSQGVVTFDTQVRNQHGTAVQSGRKILLMNTA